MNETTNKPILAVISPFLDKKHGSERIMVEWLVHLPREFDLHIYSQRLEDLDGLQYTWHRIPELPGPHLFNFLWWFVAHRLCIWKDRHLHRLRHDVILSSGANYGVADVICVHIVFAEYLKDVSDTMRFSHTAIVNWPRLIHQKLYYALVCAIESAAYKRPDNVLLPNSVKTRKALHDYFGRTDFMPVLYPGIDHVAFNPEQRMALRRDARAALNLADDKFVVLLVGNNWRNKGVRVLIEAVAQLKDLPIELLIASREDAASWWEIAKVMGVAERVHPLPLRKDVEFYYSAADAYAGPSIQDPFAMPPAEAMACGLPVIVSASAGVSEIVTDGFDGMILRDPTDAAALAAMLRKLFNAPAIRNELGANAAKSTKKYSWEQCGHQLASIFGDILHRKQKCKPRELPLES